MGFPPFYVTIGADMSFNLFKNGIKKDMFELFSIRPQ